MKKRKLPITARDIFKPGFKDRILYNSSILFHHYLGLWKFPVRVSGDLETMKRRDIIYWLYKSDHPVRRAVKNAGLEEFFDEQKKFSVLLPAGFEKQNEMTLSAAGDLMDHEYLVNSEQTLYAEVADILFGKDIVMANLECCITGKTERKLTMNAKKGPTLAFSPGIFKIIKGTQKRQYDFLATACNHSLDLGLAGVETTFRVLAEEGIGCNGINFTKNDSMKATILEKKGFRLGVICFTFGLNAQKPPVDQPYLINRLNLNDEVEKIDFTGIKKQIDYCKSQETDLLIAQLHWGFEHEFYPRPEQVSVAHYLAEAGIDLIIGHHAHVIQPMEYYRTARDPNRIVPVYYSLGNLITPFSATFLTQSGIAELKLAKGILNGETKTYIQSAGLTGIHQMADDSKRSLQLRWMQ